MTEVSIIIPSLRPETMEACLSSIHKNAIGLEYEVIVISPFDMSRHPNVVHITEDEPEGYGKAAYTGYKKAKGEYIVGIADYCHLASPLKHMVDCMRMHDDEIYEGRFFTIAVTSFLDMVAPETIPKIIPDGWYDNRYFLTIGGKAKDHRCLVFGKVFAPFMCMRKDKAEEIGGFFAYPYYKQFFLDPDLSLRVWKAGGNVETCEKAKLVVYPKPEGDTVNADNTKKYRQIDGEAFKKRWGREFSHE